MPLLKKLNSFPDGRGALTALEAGKDIDFTIQRVYYIYGVNVDVERGGHRHHKNKQVLICVHGSCDIYVHNGKKEQVFSLNQPDTCLILYSEDWHKMYNFSSDAVLLVLASEHYDLNDYIDEAYT